MLPERIKSRFKKFVLLVNFEGNDRKNKLNFDLKFRGDRLEVRRLKLENLDEIMGLEVLLSLSGEVMALLT